MLGPSALDDLRVLDLSEGIAGPLAARLLGDFGADIIKIEPLRGESGRRMPPFFRDDPDPEKSLFHLMLNLNKRGITLNLESDEGADILRALARNVDVIVESFPPGYLADRGLDHASLERANPGLVMTSITPFGQTGPYSRFVGDEITAAATGGIMAISGTVDGEPLKHGGFTGQYETGMNGFLGTLVALFTRDLSGLGQHVDLSVQDVIASSLILNQTWYGFAGGVQGRRHAEGSRFGQVMPCKDGYFVAQPGGGITWDGIADFFGRPEMKEHRFADVAERVRNGAELDGIILDATKDRTMTEMFQTASEQFRLLLGIVQTPEDLANCPHLAARGYFEEVTHPVVGTIRIPFQLWNMSDSKARCRRPAPLLGQHNDEIIGALPGTDRTALDLLRARGVI
jgi:crotonobetainyl-CoA:carnitine CoA-transferase CaiB-like acyl-CoA transferase